MPPKASALDGRAIPFMPKRKQTWFAVDDDGKPAKMMCGVHLRPANVHALPELNPADINANPGVTVLETRYFPAHGTRYVRRLRGLEVRGSCLCDYNSYPELLKERETADTETKFQFAFMKLPAELRNQVYSLLLRSSVPFEFCAEPYTMKCCYKGHPFHTAFSAAERYQQAKLLENTSPVVRMMRVSKQIHKEAAVIFYGENEFRFTNLTGWLGLDIFTHKIGLDKSKMLRHVTVCHPKFFEYPETCSQAESFGLNLSTYEKFRSHRWYHRDVGFDTKHVLEKNEKLKYLRIILPENCDGVVDCPVDEAKFANLKVVFASVVERSLWEPEWPGCDEEDDEWTPYVKSWAQETVERSGKSDWQWEDIRIDLYGCYKGDIAGVIEEVAEVDAENAQEATESGETGEVGATEETGDAEAIQEVDEIQEGEEIEEFEEF